MKAMPIKILLRNPLPESILYDQSSTEKVFYPPFICKLGFQHISKEDVVSILLNSISVPVWLVQ